MLYDVIERAVYVSFGCSCPDDIQNIKSTVELLTTGRRKEFLLNYSVTFSWLAVLIDILSRH